MTCCESYRPNISGFFTLWLIDYPNYMKNIKHIRNINKSLHLNLSLKCNGFLALYHFSFRNVYFPTKIKAILRSLIVVKKTALQRIFEILIFLQLLIIYLLYRFENDQSETAHLFQHSEGKTKQILKQNVLDFFSENRTLMELSAILPNLQADVSANVLNISIFQNTIKKIFRNQSYKS